MRRARLFEYAQADTLKSGLSAERTFAVMKNVNRVLRQVVSEFWMLLSNFYSDALLGLAAFAMPVSLGEAEVDASGLGGS